MNVQCLKCGKMMATENARKLSEHGTGLLRCPKCCAEYIYNSHSRVLTPAPTYLWQTLVAIAIIAILAIFACYMAFRP